MMRTVRYRDYGYIALPSMYMCEEWRQTGLKTELAAESPSMAAAAERQGFDL